MVVKYGWYSDFFYSVIFGSFLFIILTLGTLRLFALVWTRMAKDRQIKVVLFASLCCILPGFYCLSLPYPLHDRRISSFISYQFRFLEDSSIRITSTPWSAIGRSKLITTTKNLWIGFVAEKNTTMECQWTVKLRYIRHRKSNLNESHNKYWYFFQRIISLKINNKCFLTKTHLPVRKISLRQMETRILKSLLILPTYSNRPK